MAVIAETLNLRAPGLFSGHLEVFDVETGQAQTNLPNQATDPSVVRFSPNGLLAVITGNRDSAPNLVVCDLQAGRPVATEPLPAAFSFLNVLTFSPDGRFLIVAARQGPACQVRELPTGRLVQERSLNAAGSVALAVRPSDGEPPHDRSFWQTSASGTRHRPGRARSTPAMSSSRPAMSPWPPAVARSSP